MLKKFRLLFDLSVLSFILSGSALLLIPFAEINGEGLVKGLAYFIGAVFWSGIVFGAVFFVLTDRNRRKIENVLRSKKQNIPKIKKCGMLRFFKNKRAVSVDVIMILSAVVTVALLITRSTSYIGIGFAAVLFWTVVLHAFLNGKNYLYLNEYKRYLKKNRENAENRTNR